MLSSVSRRLPTFNSATNELLLPNFLQAHEGVSIDMFDSPGFFTFGIGQLPDNHSWQAELHLFYVQFPELCQACTCCGQYHSHGSATCKWKSVAASQSSIWLSSLESGMSGASGKQTCASKHVNCAQVRSSV